MNSRRSVNLVVEDDLSEGVCRRLLTEHDLVIGTVYGKSGFGYIKSKLKGFNHAAKGTHYFVLTDLDQRGCAKRLWSEWLPGIPRHENLIFRIAVREVESWLLADAAGMKAFLGLKSELDFNDADHLHDPKLQLLFLARRSPKRSLREALAVQTRAGALVPGPDYNGTLRLFVQARWDVSRAARASESLRRALNSIRRLAAPRRSAIS